MDSFADGALVERSLVDYSRHERVRANPKSRAINIRQEIVLVVLFEHLLSNFFQIYSRRESDFFARFVLSQLFLFFSFLQFFLEAIQNCLVRFFILIVIVPKGPLSLQTLQQTHQLGCDVN